MVDIGPVVHNGDGPPGTDILAPVGDASPAGLGDGDLVDRTLIAGDVDDLDDVGVVRIPPHGHVDPLRQNGPLLIDAAAHGGFFPRDDFLGDVVIALGQGPVKSPLGDGLQDLIL